MNNSFKIQILSPDININHVVIGLKLQDDVINDLRKQVSNLRLGLAATGIQDKIINELQFVHLSKSVV